MGRVVCLEMNARGASLRRILDCVPIDGNDDGDGLDVEGSIIIVDASQSTNATVVISTAIVVIVAWLWQGRRVASGEGEGEQEERWTCSSELGNVMVSLFPLVIVIIQ